MAERRMFAKTIVLSDSFLDMPMSSRCLYFTLSMLADDDGFVNAPKSIMRQAGCSEDDFRILLARKFILAFESGVIVIKHWRINNYLRSDRYTETKYVEEKNCLSIEANGSYSSENTLDTVGIPSGIPSIGKDSIGKISKGKDTLVSENLFNTFWNSYPRKTNKEEAKKAWNKLNPSEELVQEMMTAIEAWKTSEQWKEPRYIPHPSTWLNQKRWQDELPEDPYEKLRRQIEEMEKRQ